MEMAGIAACIIVMSSHCCDSLILYNFNVTHLLPLGSQITFSRVGFFPSKHNTTQHIWRVKKFLAVLLLILLESGVERCLSLALQSVILYTNYWHAAILMKTLVRSLQIPLTTLTINSKVVSSDSKREWRRPRTRCSLQSVVEDVLLLF